MGGLTLPQPYYDDGQVTIYHGDCRDVLPTLEPVDLVLTDPPYGIGRDGHSGRNNKRNPRLNWKKYEFGGWDNATPDRDVFESIFAGSRDQVIWGGNYFTEHLPPRMGWLVWDKGQKLTMSDAELAFTSRHKALRLITLNRGEITRDGAVHPTQKPVRLMQWCLGFFPDAKTVLDPFMGSGSTLVAARLEGRRAIGIEIDERYCEIAVKRLQQAVLPLEIA